jgi:hypothetical protein
MSSTQVAARERRQRLWNPAGGRRSSELEIVPQHAFRRRLLIVVENEQPEGSEMPVIPEDERRKLYTQAFSECLTIMREALGDAGIIIAKEVLALAERANAEPPMPKPIRIVDVLRAVSAFYSIPINDVLSSRKSAPLVRARQVTMYLARKLTLNSLSEIGRRIGQRDHTTVHHGIERLEYLMETDDQLEADVEHIRTTLKDQRFCQSPADPNQA